MIFNVLRSNDILFFSHLFYLYTLITDHRFNVKFNIFFFNNRPEIHILEYLKKISEKYLQNLGGKFSKTDGRIRARYLREHNPTRRALPLHHIKSGHGVVNFLSNFSTANFIFKHFLPRIYFDLFTSKFLSNTYVSLTCSFWTCCTFLSRYSSKLDQSFSWVTIEVGIRF